MRCGLKPLFLVKGTDLKDITKDEAEFENVGGRNKSSTECDARA